MIQSLMTYTHHWRMLSVTKKNNPPCTFRTSRCAPKVKLTVHVLQSTRLTAGSAVPGWCTRAVVSPACGRGGRLLGSAEGLCCEKLPPTAGLLWDGRALPGNPDVKETHRRSNTPVGSVPQRCCWINMHLRVFLFCTYYYYYVIFFWELPYRLWTKRPPLPRHHWITHLLLQSHAVLLLKAFALADQVALLGEDGGGRGRFLRRAALASAAPQSPHLLLVAADAVCAARGEPNVFPVISMHPAHISDQKLPEREPGILNT